VSLTISVIGTGYLGVVHAACMADLGHTVIAIDTDEAKVESLSRGVAPIYEPGLGELLASVLATGRLRFTTDYAEAAGADVHFICVGTPQRKGEKAADTSYVFDAGRSLAPHLGDEALVVGKSTVPVGTAARLLDRLQAGAPAGVTARLAWNPEFLREGFAIADTVAPDRFVYGVNGSHAEADVALLDEVYAGPLASGTPRLVTDFPTAELVKVAANAFLATKISFINAMAEVCEAAGADVVQLADAIGHDDRIGRKFLNAGVGFGGGCLPKDIRAFMARAGELGADQALTFLRERSAAARSSASGWLSSGRRSSPTATTSVTRLRWTSPRRPARQGRSSPFTTRRPSRRPSASTRTLSTPRPWSRSASTPTSCCT